MPTYSSFTPEPHSPPPQKGFPLWLLVIVILLCILLAWGVWGVLQGYLALLGYIAF